MGGCGIEREGVAVLARAAVVGGGEAPVDGGGRGVAVGRPGGDLRREGGLDGEAAPEALARERAQRAHGHIASGAVLGGGADRQLLGELLGLGGREGVVGGNRGVGVVDLDRIP